MRTDIRLKTCLIVRKEGRYLVAREVGSGKLRWSGSAWDAWRTRKREDASRVAAAVRGELVLFNSLTGQKQTMK